MQRPASPEHPYFFLEFTLDVAAQRLLCGTEDVKLRPKSFQVLQYLVEHPGRVVTRDELLRHAWGDIVVSDESVTKCIADVRKALRDDSQQIIRTVTRRGFLFKPEVRVGWKDAAEGLGAARQIAPPVARTRAIVAGAFVVLAFGVVSLVWGRHLLSRGPVFESIAVLPFASLSSGPDQQYLADGLTEALITNLGQASPLRVIARTSVNHYRNTTKTVHEIARELKVDVLIEGTITQLHDGLRITANLIQVSPERHIWARTYERKIGEALALEGELAGEIADEILAKLVPGHRARVRSRNSIPEAQSACSKARFFIHSRRDPESAKKSLAYATEAVRMDPQYAEAHAALAEAYVMLTYMGVPPPGGSRTPAKAAAERAIALDPNLAEAHNALGQVLFLYDRDVKGAERALQRALSINPSHADARMNLAGCLSALGRVDEAVVEIKRARRLDPLSFLINREVGRMLYFARRYDEALVELRQAEEMQPNSSAVGWWVVRCLLRKGMMDEAVAEDIRMRRNRDQLDEHLLSDLQAASARGGPRGYWTKLREVVRPIYSSGSGGKAHLVDISLRLGNREEALQWLQESPNMWMRVEPELDPLRSDPRFTAMLQRQGLAP